MGRKAVLLGFWVAGYLVGAFAWMVKSPALQFVENLGLSTDASQALLSGLFGSFVMVISVLFWAFLSSD